jgi:hypothetical protein
MQTMIASVTVRAFPIMAPRPPSPIDLLPLKIGTIPIALVEAHTPSYPAAGTSFIPLATRQDGSTTQGRR